MGVSTDAILFYGYCWDDEAELLPNDADGDHPEWPEVIARRRGLVNPWDAAPPELNNYLPRETYDQKEARVKVWLDAHRAELDSWYAVKSAITAEFACDIGRHCSDNCSMPYVFVNDSKFVARRGHPVRIDPSNLLVAQKPEWPALLAEFCRALDIEPPQAHPAWWLVSYWG